MWGFQGIKEGSGMQQCKVLECVQESRKGKFRDNNGNTYNHQQRSHSWTPKPHSGTAILVHITLFLLHPLVILVFLLMQNQSGLWWGPDIHDILLYIVCSISD